MTKVLVDAKQFVLLVNAGEFFVLLVNMEDEDESTRRMKSLRILSFSSMPRNLFSLLILTEEEEGKFLDSSSMSMSLSSML